MPLAHFPLCNSLVKSNTSVLPTALTVFFLKECHNNDSHQLAPVAPCISQHPIALKRASPPPAASLPYRSCGQEDIDRRCRIRGRTPSPHPCDPRIRNLPNTLFIAT